MQLPSGGFSLRALFMSVAVVAVLCAVAANVLLWRFKRTDTRSLVSLIDVAQKLGAGGCTVHFQGNPSYFPQTIGQCEVRHGRIDEVAAKSLCESVPVLEILCIDTQITESADRELLTAFVRHDSPAFSEWPIPGGGRVAVYFRKPR